MITKPLDKPVFFWTQLPAANAPTAKIPITNAPADFRPMS